VCSGDASAHSSENTGVTWLGLVTVKLKEFFQSQIEKTQDCPGTKGALWPLIQENGKNCSSQNSLIWMSPGFVKTVTRKTPWIQFDASKSKSATTDQHLELIFSKH
jgi:hypothetical protein